MSWWTARATEARRGCVTDRERATGAWRSTRREVTRGRNERAGRSAPLDARPKTRRPIGTARTRKTTRTFRFGGTGATTTRGRRGCPRPRRRCGHRRHRPGISTWSGARDSCRTIRTPGIFRRATQAEKVRAARKGEQRTRTRTRRRRNVDARKPPPPRAPPPIYPTPFVRCRTANPRRSRRNSD